MAKPQTCEQLPASTVTLQRLESPVDYKYGLSYQALKAMSQQYDRHDQFVLGLTRTQAVARVSAESAVLRDKTGQWECATHQLRVEYGFQPMTVYVSREFPQGACAFEQIHTHEMLHVNAYQTHAKLIESEIADVLRQRFEGAGPSRGRPGETQQRLQQEISERWIPYLKRMLEKVHAEQRLIDSREEYEKVAASCGGAIRQVVGRLR